MFKSEKIKLLLSSKNIGRYRKIHGEHLKNKDIIEININELPINSRAKIDVICDGCNTEKLIPFCDYMKHEKPWGVYYCLKCNGKAIKEGCLRIHGVTNVFQLESVKEKTKETCIEKYNETHHLKNKTILAKQTKTNNERYGVNFIPQLKKHTTETFIKKSQKIHGYIYDYSKVNYSIIDEKVIIVCKKHGEFLQKADDHLKGMGCSICNLSKGEIAIMKYLDERNIKYENQKKFDDCKYKGKLPFDFYLPDYNICIEYDGIQHYEAIKNWGGEDELLLRKIKDEIKTLYCLENNIKLIRIKYNENVVDRLLFFFTKNPLHYFDLAVE